jgi:hypothetical protein
LGFPERDERATSSSVKTAIMMKPPPKPAPPKKGLPLGIGKGIIFVRPGVDLTKPTLPVLR